MAESPDGKAKGRLVHRTPTFLLAASLLAVATAASAQTLPEKGEPPISAQTEISGGERPPEQQAMRFDVADLAIEVLPETRRLKGVATLTFTATAPLARLVIDLDTNLWPQGIAIDGRSEEHTSELKSLMRNSYAVFRLTHKPPT